MAKVKQETITRLEREINNLWGELNTVNIPHNVRITLEHQMQEIEDEFKQVVDGKNSASITYSSFPYMRGITFALSSGIQSLMEIGAQRVSPKGLMPKFGGNAKAIPRMYGRLE